MSLLYILITYISFITLIDTLEKNMCDRERQYLLHQQRVESMIHDDEMFVEDGTLNVHGFDMPTIPHVRYDLACDDTFMVAKMDEMVITSGTRVHIKDVCNESSEHVQIEMFDQIIWSGKRLPLNSQERWKWIMSQYEIQHALWMYPDDYFVGSDRQPTIRAHDVELLDTNLVALSLEELCDLEQIYNHTDQYVYDINNHLKSILWKVGGEGNPIKSSQAPLLSDVFLEMHCIQVIHRTLNKSNTYRMDDKKDKVKYLDPDWERTTTELVYEMSEQYRIQGINIPQSILDKLSSFQMSLGTHSHQNYAMIDDLVSEAIQRLCLPGIVAGGFAARRLGHTIQHNNIDIFAYVPPWFDSSTLEWRFGPCFPNVYNERHEPEGLGWPQSSQSNNPPHVSWSVKHYPVKEYSILSMRAHWDFADAVEMSVVQCVISHSDHPHKRLLFHPYEKSVVFRFILLKTRSEDQCLKLYGNTSLMIHKIVDGFDIDPCKCFGVKWKRSVNEMPCLLKYQNSDDMIYMHVSDIGVWPTQDDVVKWDGMWTTVKDGMQLYTHVYNKCLNDELPWAIKQAAAYIDTYHMSLNKSQPERERVKHISVLSHGITCLNDMLHKYVWGTQILITSGLLNM